jgi:hypothetical protein
MNEEFYDYLLDKIKEKYLVCKIKDYVQEMERAEKFISLMNDIKTVGHNRNIIQSYEEKEYDFHTYNRVYLMNNLFICFLSNVFERHINFVYPVNIKHNFELKYKYTMNYVIQRKTFTYIMDCPDIIYPGDILSIYIKRHLGHNYEKYEKFDMIISYNYNFYTRNLTFDVLPHILIEDMYNYVNLKQYEKLKRIIEKIKYVCIDRLQR